MFEIELYYVTITLSIALGFYMGYDKGFKDGKSVMLGFFKNGGNPSGK